MAEETKDNPFLKPGIKTSEFKLIVAYLVFLVVNDLLKIAWGAFGEAGGFSEMTMLIAGALTGGYGLIRQVGKASMSLPFNKQELERSVKTVVEEIENGDSGGD